MTIDNILLQYVSKQYGITEEAAAELLYQTSEDGKETPTLKEGALQILLDRDKERVKGLKSTEVDKTAIYDQAFIEAKQKVLAKEEKKLAKKYGIEGEDFKLETLVEDIIARSLEGAKVTGAVTEDTVKKHPAYLALERAKTEEVNTLQAKHQAELDKIQTDYSRTQTLGEVKGKVLTIFDALKPVLSKDVTRAANQRALFAERFEAYSYEQQADNTFLVLDANGKRVEDDHGNPISLEKLVERNASQFYDFAVQDPKGAPGNGPGSGVNSGGKEIKVPTSEDEFNMAIINAGSSEEREAITAAYGAAK